MAALYSDSWWVLKKSLPWQNMQKNVKLGMNSSPSKRGTNLPRTNIDAWKMIHFPLKCSPFGGHFFYFFFGGGGEFDKNA